MIPLQLEHSEVMPKAKLFDPIQILYGANKTVQNGAVLIEENELVAFEDAATKKITNAQKRPGSIPNTQVLTIRFRKFNKRR